MTKEPLSLRRKVASFFRAVFLALGQILNGFLIPIKKIRAFFKKSSSAEKQTPDMPLTPKSMELGAKPSPTSSPLSSSPPRTPKSPTKSDSEKKRAIEGRMFSDLGALVEDAMQIIDFSKEDVDNARLFLASSRLGYALEFKSPTLIKEANDLIRLMQDYKNKYPIRNQALTQVPELFEVVKFLLEVFDNTLFISSTQGAKTPAEQLNAMQRDKIYIAMYYLQKSIMLNTNIIEEKNKVWILLEETMTSLNKKPELAAFIDKKRQALLVSAENLKKGLASASPEALKLSSSVGSLNNAEKFIDKVNVIEHFMSALDEAERASKKAAFKP